MNKFEKELSMIYPVNHPKRVKIHQETQEILQKIHKLNKNE